MKKILIIGGGSIGKRHAKNLLSLGEKNIMIVEVNPERAAAVEKELSLSTVPSLEAGLDKKPDIAFVCSPSIYHLEQAMLCAARGLDIFVEKPLSHTTKGLTKLLKLTKLKKPVTMVGSNWKFYPSFQKMKELLDADAIGKLLSARCQFGFYLPDWHPWEDYRKGYSANKTLGGGILLDSHEFDYLPWFVGKKVEKLACIAGKVSDLEIDVEDTAEVIFQFEGGAIGEMHLDYIQRIHQRSFEFFGELGSLFWDIRDKRVVLEKKGEEQQVFPLAGGYDLNAMYVEEAKHFLDCIEKRKETITPVEKGAETLRLILAAKKSSKTRKTINI